MINFIIVCLELCMPSHVILRLVQGDELNTSVHLKHQCTLYTSNMYCFESSQFVLVILSLLDCNVTLETMEMEMAKLIFLWRKIFTCTPSIQQILSRAV